jgi:hypothetical protein
MLKLHPRFDTQTWPLCEVNFRRTVQKVFKKENLGGTASHPPRLQQTRVAMRSCIRPVIVAMLAASSLPGAGAFLPGSPGVFVSSGQGAGRFLGTGSQLGKIWGDRLSAPRARKDTVTCGLKDVLFSWRNSRIRTAQTSWHQSLFKVPRMGTRVEEEELKRREEAAAKAKAGSFWETDLSTADGEMAVDQAAAAAARKRRAQLASPEEERQEKMAYGFGDEPSKEERLQREKEAAADMQRVLGAKAARLRSQEVPPFSRYTHT